MRPWRPITLPTSSGATWRREDRRVVPLLRLDADGVGVVDELPRDPGEQLRH